MGLRVKGRVIFRGGCRRRVVTSPLVYTRDGCSTAGKAGARRSSLASNAGKTGEAAKAGEAGKIGSLFRETWLERGGVRSDGGER